MSWILAHLKKEKKTHKTISKQKTPLSTHNKRRHTPSLLNWRIHKPIQVVPHQYKLTRPYSTQPVIILVTKLALLVTDALILAWSWLTVHLMKPKKQKRILIFTIPQGGKHLKCSTITQSIAGIELITIVATGLLIKHILNRKVKVTSPPEAVYNLLLLNAVGLGSLILSSSLNAVRSGNAIQWGQLNWNQFLNWFFVLKFLSAGFILIKLPIYLSLSKDDLVVLLLLTLVLLPSMVLASGRIAFLGGDIQWAIWFLTWFVGVVMFTSINLTTLLVTTTTATTIPIIASVSHY